MAPVIHREQAPPPWADGLSADSAACSGDRRAFLLSVRGVGCRDGRGHSEVYDLLDAAYEALGREPLRRFLAEAKAFRAWCEGIKE